MKGIIVQIGWLITLGLGHLWSSQGAVTRPNIMVILTDDQGWAQNGLYHDIIDTSKCAPKGLSPRYECDPKKAAEAAQKSMPHLSQMAKEGIRFTDAHVPSPVCGPSRAALLTGQYPQRFGIYFNKDILAAGIDQDEAHLALTLQRNGYRNAMIGKWHVARPIWHFLDVDSRDYHDRHLTLCKEGQHPLDCGFDHYYGFNHSGTPYYDSPNLFRNRENVQSRGYSTDDFTQEALSFIDQNAGQNPFFIYLAYNSVHTPLEKPAPKKYLSRFNTGNPRVDNYYASLAAVDDGLGKILKRLAHHGIDDNTLVFFLSDNGAVVESPLPLNGEFVGFKGQAREGGTRVPMVLRWPSALPSPKIYSQMVSSMDVLPTALAAAGLEVKNVDGKNLLPYLLGYVDTPPHEHLYWAGPQMLYWDVANLPFWENFSNYLNFKVDQRIQTLHSVYEAPASYTVRKGHWMLSYTEGQGMSLYDLSQDPSTNQDLIAHKPELAQEMKRSFQAWSKNLAKPKKWDLEKWTHLK